MNKDAIQKTKMCIATYFNLFGVMPSITDMVEWTGESYEVVFNIYAAEGLTPPVGTAA